MTAVEVHHVVTERPGLPAGAPTVVLSGSLGATHTMWDRNVPALAAHFRVVTYDARGHGASPVPPGPYSLDDLADDVVALLDRLEVKRAHVVGLSLGGMTSMRLAIRNPGRVDRLVLLSTAAYLPPAQAWHDRAALVRAEGSGTVADAVVGRWYTPAFAAAHPEQVRATRDRLAATPPEGYASCCEAVAAMDLRGDLAGIVAPTLVVSATEDPSTPPEHLQAIADGIAGSRLVTIGGAAHLCNDEQPAAVDEAILGHLLRP